MARLGIIGITTDERDAIRYAVGTALRYWPNDGGDETPREHIRRAFKFLRANFTRGSLVWAAHHLEMDAQRYEDM
jgi:hypothetical protein